MKKTPLPNLSGITCSPNKPPRIHTSLRRYWPAILLMAAALMPAVTAFPAGAAGESCTELLKNRCETCHYLTRVCLKVEQEQGSSSWFGSSGSWKRTVRNMVRQGAKVSNAEEKILVDCLSTPVPEVLDLCGLKK